MLRLRQAWANCDVTFKAFMRRTRSLGALRTTTPSWRPFGPLDFVLYALRALRLCDPRRCIPYTCIHDCRSDSEKPSLLCLKQGFSTISDDLVFTQCTCCIFTNIYVPPKRGEYILGIAFSRQFHPLYRRLYKRRLLLLSTRHKYTSAQAVPMISQCQANYFYTFWFGHKHIDIVPPQGSLVHKDQILLLTSIMKGTLLQDLNLIQWLHKNSPNILSI